MHTCAHTTHMCTPQCTAHNVHSHVCTPRHAHTPTHTCNICTVHMHVHACTHTHECTHIHVHTPYTCTQHNAQHTGSLTRVRPGCTGKHTPTHTAHMHVYSCPHSHTYPHTYLQPCTLLEPEPQALTLSLGSRLMVLRGRRTRRTRRDLMVLMSFPLDPLEGRSHICRQAACTPVPLP